MVGRSKVWRLSKFVDDTRAEVACSLCPVKIKYVGNTTNIARHLELKHPIEFAALEPTSSVGGYVRRFVHPHQKQEEDAISRILAQHHEELQRQENNTTIKVPVPGQTKIWAWHIPVQSLPTGDDRGGGGGSSEVSQNNGDDVSSMVVSASPPEHFLAEIGERDPSPTPPTPTHQKPESYQLRHNNHLTLVLEALAQDESFMDVTLTAQGRSLKAHKSVLSAVSPYFRGVLRDNPCQHPIIIMPRDVRFEELYSIVNYIYKGEMTVAAEDLTSLLKTAEILQVSGLAPSDTSATLNPQHESSTTTTTHPRSSSTSSSASSTTVPPRSARSTKPRTTPPVRPKSRDSSINPSDFIDIDMTCVKEEVTSGGEEDDGEEQMPKGSNPRSPSSQQHHHQQQQHSDPLHQQALPTFSPTYNQGLQQSLPSTSSDQGFQNVAASVNSSQSTDSSLGIKTDPDTDVNQGMCAMETPTPLVCPHCEERHREVDSLLTHLRLRHPTKPSFTCGCGRVFTRQTYQQAHSKVCPNAS